MSEILFRVSRNQFTDFFLGIIDFPTIEIRCLLIIVIQNLTNDFLVVSIAEGLCIASDPFLGFFLLTQIYSGIFVFFVTNGTQIWVILIFPAVFEFFSYSTTTFTESCITNAFFIH